MLEFLKDFSRFNIYGRARDCEINLKSFDSMTSMAVFFESVFKSIYNVFFEEDINVVSSYSLNDLLKDDYFIARVREKYGISDSDYEIIDKNIRIGSNKNKHGLDSAGNNKKRVKTAFKCLYDFASNYYNVETGLTAPAWSDEDYEALISDEIDENARAKAEKAYSEKIKTLKAETDLLRKQKEDFQINLLNLRKEIDQIRKESIPVDQYNIITNSINKLKDDITRKETDIIRLEENAAKSGEEKKLLKEAYESQISEVKLKLEEAEKKYIEISNNSSQKNKILDLENEIKHAESQLMLSQGQLQNKEKELASVSTKLHEAQDEIDRLNQLHAESLKERKQKQNLIDELQKECNALNQLKGERSTPACPKCGASMIAKQGNFGCYWACPNYKRACEGFTRSISQEEYCLYEKEITIAKCVEEKKRTINAQKAEIEESSKIFRKEQAHFPLNGFNRNLSSDIECYPVQYTNFVPTTYLFESLSVPPEIFGNRQSLSLKKYSQFKIISNAAVHNVNATEKTIFSLILRLLNRGIILSSYEGTAKKLKAKFNINEEYQISSPACLSEYVQYKTPFMISSSAREQEFANYYFPQILGDSWASYVFSQVGFDLLVPNMKENSYFYGQKVDYLVQVNDTKVVIELDGPEHAYSKSNDQSRDRYLQSNQYTVLRFTNDEVDRKDEKILEKLKEAIPQDISSSEVIELNEKYLVSCKLSHQIAISLIKALEQGYIGKRSCIRASISSKMFSDTEAEFILTVTLQEIKAILKAYADIYGIADEWSFDDEADEIFRICIGEGSDTADKGIVIRDCRIPYDFLCLIDKFDESVKPRKISRISGDFLSRYIFGYERLKSEQYRAIERLITRKDSIILLPTGSGKSTIYQLSSYIVPGLIIVIAPLVSLIRDQVTNMESKFGIDNVSFIYGAKSESEIAEKNEEMLKMKRTATSLLYVAPERLQISSFAQSAEKMRANNNVFSIAIDEAHCVSEWGHDFRSAYLNIGNSSRHLFRNSIGEVPVIVALTGTASDAVLNDMKRDLGITAKDAVIEPDTFERKELHFSLVSCSPDDKAAVIADLIKNKLPLKFEKTYEEFSALNKDNTNSGIVFTPLATGSATSQYSALNVQATISNMLPELGTACYFSKTPDDYTESVWRSVIRDNADKFKNNNLNLLVATKAFGMGIDKPNIRFTIHDGIPASLEEFYQEAGRAGRDHKKSECIIVFSDENFEENIKLLTSHYENFSEQYNNYMAEYVDQDKKDDLSALFYFHNSSYAGVEKESKLVSNAIDWIKAAWTSSEPIDQHTITLSYNKKNGKTYEESIAELIPFESWTKTLVRLSILNVVEYYSIDYGKKLFTITFGSLNKKNIIGKFVEYATANAISNKAPIDTKLNELYTSEKEGWSFVELAVRQLITYVYENIESSRREAIRYMYETAGEMKNAQSDLEQHEIVKKRINYYFSATTETKDLLQSIVSDDDLGIELSMHLLNVDTPRDGFTNEEIESAEKVYVRATRLLESEPTHPGLLLTRAATAIISEKYNKTLLLGDIIAACNYATKEYAVAKETVFETMCSISNLLLDSSAEVFNECIDQLPEALEMDKMDIYDSLLNSSRISDENREYILLQYTLQKLYILKGIESL